jgi:hypothetical protein
MAACIAPGLANLRAIQSRRTTNRLEIRKSRTCKGSREEEKRENGEHREIWSVAIDRNTHKTEVKELRTTYNTYPDLTQRQTQE